MYVCLYTYAHTHKQTHTQTPTQTSTHAHTHTHTNTSTLSQDEWRNEGHEYIGMRIQRPVMGAFGRVVKMSEAKIVGWLPADESDYKNKDGEAAALWHILWNDGAEEDLEEWEVQESLQASVDDCDDFASGGMWSSGRDRKEWLGALNKCRTVGAAALGLYLLGDRALPLVANL